MGYMRRDAIISAIESAVHQQYAEWVAKQEPVAYVEHHKAGDNLVWDSPGDKGSPIFTHPAPDDTGVRDAEAELNCAEEVLESLSIDLPMEETGFDCLGDYVTAVFAAQKQKETELLKQALDALEDSTRVVSTMIGNSLMSEPSMFERSEVCKFVRGWFRRNKVSQTEKVITALRARLENKA